MAKYVKKTLTKSTQTQIRSGSREPDRKAMASFATPSIQSRWALSYNMQSRIASQTREVFCADPDDDINHSGHNRGRRGQVETDEANLSSWSLNQLTSSPSTPIILAYEPSVINKYTYHLRLRTECQQVRLLS